MGLAIITVYLPATNTIINETTCGIILEKRNAQLLAKAIQNLLGFGFQYVLENPGKRKQFQENALHWEKKKFNWQSEEEKLFQFYNCLK